MILSARDLCFAYPAGAIALKGLNLDVSAGQRLAILGANGAGKTTLLMHLNGTLRPDQGEIRLDGHPVAYDRRSLIRWRQAVGLVLQDPDDQLFAGTVHQDISFGPFNLGLPEAEVRSRVDRALAAMGIEELARRPIHALSFGQKKRVAIAGVLVMAPKVLVLDEPTGGLDGLGVAHLVAALDALVAGGTSVVYATHDVDLACAWSDRVAVFSDGRVGGFGPPDAVLADRELLRRAGLRTPTAIEAGLAARELGLIPTAAPLPRSRSDLIRLLRWAVSAIESRTAWPPPAAPTVAAADREP